MKAAVLKKYDKMGCDVEVCDIPVPEVYKSSADFRVFLKWFEEAL